MTRRKPAWATETTPEPRSPTPPADGPRGPETPLPTKDDTRCEACTRRRIRLPCGLLFWFWVVLLPVWALQLAFIGKMWPETRFQLLALGAIIMDAAINITIFAIKLRILAAIARWLWTSCCS